MNVLYTTWLFTTLSVALSSAIPAQHIHRLQSRPVDVKAEWAKTRCKGGKFAQAMIKNEDAAAAYVTPVRSASEGDLVQQFQTWGYREIGNHRSELCDFLLNVRSAKYAAKMYWAVEPASDQLPALRSSSDIAWGFWNRINWSGPGTIRAFMNMMVVNADTARIIDQVLKMRDVDLPLDQQTRGVHLWPGTTFSVDRVEEQAQFGSPNGIAAGFFLAQHKR